MNSHQTTMKRILCLALALAFFCGTALAGYETLERGDKGDDVLSMQMALAALGYILDTDGVYGRGTSKIVEQFQKDQGLKADGRAGDKTLTRLYELMPVFKPTGTSGSASGSTSSGSASSGSTQAVTVARVVTTGGTLSLRKTQSTGAAALKLIPNMTVLPIIERGSKWCKAAYDGATGYVLTSYLRFDTTVTQPTAAPTKAPASSAYTALVKTTGGTLTLRQKRLTNSAALKLIPNRTVLFISERGSTWCTATYDGATGYVLTRYLDFTFSSADLATATPTAAPTATPTATPITQNPPAQITGVARVKTTGGTLTLRKTQSTGSAALARIPNGTLLTYSAYGEKWTKAVYAGDTGYVLTSYLDFTVGAATPSPTPTLPPVSSSSAQVRTTGGTLTLREKRSTNAAALRLIPNLTIVSVAEKGSTWCTVLYDGVTGYVLTKYLNFNTIVTATPTASPTPTATPTADIGAPSGLSAIVKTSGGTLTLRETMSTRADALAYIPNGAAVTVLDASESWCLIYYNGERGYVLTDYLVFSASTSAPTATPTSTPTPTPVPSAPAETDAPAYDTSVFYRTLKSGYTGQDVTLTQQRLVALNYLSRTSGTYDSETIAAVKLFQTIHGLTSDGLAGANTFTALFSDGALAYSATMETYKTLRIYYETVDTSLTSDVTRLQKALVDLGYPLTVTGKFDENTHNSVVFFQMRNGLTTDGKAGPSVQTKLYSGSAKGYSATPSLVLEDNAGYMQTPAKSSIQLLHWYNVVKPALSGGSRMLIFDPNTNLSWTLVVYARGHHADSQPLTLRDTLIMNKSFGKTNWTVHPVYVQLPDGRWTMATMHNRPHLTGSIASNGFDGHLCVHFLRDMDECRANDPNYGVSNQNTLRSAWKSLTGETVD